MVWPTKELVDFGGKTKELGYFRREAAKILRFGVPECISYVRIRAFGQAKIPEIFSLRRAKCSKFSACGELPRPTIDLLDFIIDSTASEPLTTIVYLAPGIWDLEKSNFFTTGNHQKSNFFHEK